MTEMSLQPESKVLQQA